MKKIIAMASIAAFVLSATTASAFWNITVTSSNSAVITNNVTTNSNTGGNTAGGGAAVNFDDGSANAGHGGVVFTGNAVGVTSVTNLVNSNDVLIRRDCGCRGDVSVHTRNDNTLVRNVVDTDSNTGDNSATGGEALNSGFGWWWWGNNGSANAGNGGFVDTGSSFSESNIVNVVNSNLTRVLR